MSDNEKVSVTIKYSGQRDAPWVVFHADTIEEARNLVAEAYGLQLDYIDTLTLDDVVVQASQNARNKKATVKTLGATIVSGGPDDGSPTGADALDAAEANPQSEPADPYAPLVSEFESAPSLDSLKKLYARHKDAYEASEAVQAAYKKRGKELSKKAKA